MDKALLSKILVIDDDKDILALAKIALRKFDVCCAGSGKEGIAEASRFRPDLILLDVFMPDLNGFEVADRIHAQKATRHIPIVYLSAEEVEGLAIHKPFNPAALAKEVEEVWERCE